MPLRMRKADALDHDTINFEVYEHGYHGVTDDIYSHAGFDNHTGVDAAMRSPCQFEAGFALLAQSDDTYEE